MHSRRGCVVEHVAATTRGEWVLISITPDELLSINVIPMSGTVIQLEQPLATCSKNVMVMRMYESIGMRTRICSKRPAAPCCWQLQGRAKEVLCLRVAKSRVLFDVSRK